MSLSTNSYFRDPISILHLAGKEACPNRVVYIVTADDELAKDLTFFTRGQGISSQRFSTLKEYLGHRRLEIPGCLVLDHQLRNANEIKETTGSADSSPVIIVSATNDIFSCVQAMRAGVHDILTLPLMRSRLQQSITEALDKDLAALKIRREYDSLCRRWHSLTSREAEVMRYSVAGLLNKQTASELDIAENTVQVHRGRVMRKMEANSFAGLVRMALILAELGEQTLLRVDQANTGTIGRFHEAGTAVYV